MKKILVVDDDESVLMLYADELMEEGYNVITSKGYFRLMTMIEEQNPDLLVMGVRCAKSGKLVLVQDIRNAWVNLPIILCYAFPVSKHNVKGVVADSYVIKGFDPSGLKLEVRRILEGGAKSVHPRHQRTQIGEQGPVEQMRFR